MKAHVLLSELDWSPLDRGHGTRPARDAMSGVVTDGQTLTLGEETTSAANLRHNAAPMPFPPPVMTMTFVY